MNYREQTAPAAEGPWNPGLDSELPREYLPLATIFRAENVSTSIAKAHELGDFSGLPARELVAFRPARLIVHELLIRVTSNVAVPDGPDYEDLGINFRRIASSILEAHIAPHYAELTAVFERLKSTASALIAQELDTQLSRRSTPADRPEPERRSRWPLRFAKPKPQPLPPPQSAEQRELKVICEWERKAQSADDRLGQACLHALSTVATAIRARRGRLPASNELLTELAVTLVCNDYGSEVMGEAIDPFFREAIVREGYHPLSAQERPVVMNVKGASASGKSTMRPLHRILANRLGLPWEEFALISPDIWRKFLLDYGSLGPAYKYAGTLTGHELEIVDQKLDRYMANKAERGETSHLLIDRFRFDSFTPVAEGREPTRLLTRFGNLVYMFFMITPPEMTVERAWTRGLRVGRYKAVEDLLAHNIEAYSGMPELFFTWALDPTRQVHYELLDNSVAENSPPRTVAFGWNGEMTILDLKSVLDIERFRKINLHARGPQDLYFAAELEPKRNVEFLKRCARLIPIINFADHGTGEFYARLERGKWTWRDEERFAGMLADPDAKAALEAVAPNKYDPAAAGAPPRISLDVEKLHTLGAWGDAARGN